MEESRKKRILKLKGMFALILGIIVCTFRAYNLFNSGNKSWIYILIMDIIFVIAAFFYAKKIIAIEDDEDE